MKKKGYLTLKWGSLKSWDFSENPVAQKLLEEWSSIGYSMSAIAHHDTPKQKELICAMIDAVPGKIYLDWDGKEVSKKLAKKYVMEYGA